MRIDGASIDTKVLPSKPGDHAPHNLRRVFEGSLTILAPHKVRVLYLHAPDHTVPYEQTLGEVDRMYKEGML